MKLFIKNIEGSINELALEGLFATYGKVVNTKIVYDKITWESKGFGFIEMSEDAAAAARARVHGARLRGRALVVAPATGRPMRAVAR